MPPTDRPAPALFVAIALVFAIVWFLNLGGRVLQHPDEGRYAEIAREMAATGDWLTPRLDGLKYFEKPPLQYWLTAAAFDAFGAHEWTARLWPAVAGAVAVVVLAWAGAAVGGAALGWATGLALAGTFWHVALSHVLTLDALLSALLAVAFAALVVAQQPGRTATERRNVMWLAWIALAGATLTKGLVALVIPAASLVLYTALTRDLAVWRRLHLASGLLLFFALTVPWFVAVSRANPEFAQFFFIHEHFERYLTTEHRRTGSIGYFVPLLAAGVLPWITVLMVGLVRAWRDGSANALGFSWQRFALVWAGFVFVFFSLSGSKLPSYILPMFPPLALVVGWLALRLPVVVMRRALWPLAAGAVVVAVLAWVAYPQLTTHFTTEEQRTAALAAFGPWARLAFVAAAAGMIGGIGALRADTPVRRRLGVALLALGSLASAQLIVAGLDSFRTTRSGYDILREASAATGDRPALSSPDIPFFQVHMYDQTVPFYLRRTTTLVDFTDEFALGIESEPGRVIGTPVEWAKLWAALPQGYALIPREDHDAFVAGGIPMHTLAADTRRVIVSRR